MCLKVPIVISLFQLVAEFILVKGFARAKCITKQTCAPSLELLNKQANFLDLVYNSNCVNSMICTTRPNTAGGIDQHLKEKKKFSCK